MASPRNMEEEIFSETYEPEPSKQSLKRARDEEEEEDDEGEDEDDDDEDEDEEEEEEKSRKRKGKGQKRRKSRRNQFIDDLADVDDEDEEEEEEEDGIGGPEDDFIDRNETIEADRSSRRNLLRDINGGDDYDLDAGHRGLDMSRQAREDADLGQIAADFRERYGRQSRAAARDMGEHIPKNLLMPSVDDPSIWAVKCKPGREKDLVASIFRKFEVHYNTPQALRIISAFYRDSLKGYIYVEARLESDVHDAVQGFVGIYKAPFRMVPIEEMPDLLRTKKRETVILPGGWVRIKRGKYQGDLAQVSEVTENADEVLLRFVPRIDLNPKEEGMQVGPDGKKKKKGSTTSGGIGFRPPQKFFNPEEVRKAYQHNTVTRANRGGGFMFNGDFFKDGYIQKDFKITALLTADIHPTIDEIAKFLGDPSATGETNQDLNLVQIAELTKKASVIVLQPGDHVEVFEGDQKGIQGTVHSIANNIVIVDPSPLTHPELKGAQIEIPAHSIRKSFKPGDHVKVMAGQNIDETGLVIRVREEVVTFLSDLSCKEVEVFARDLRVAAEVGSSVNTFGQFELYDLVQLDPQTTGVIFKIERDTFKVIDQNGNVRSVKPNQISAKKDSRHAIATDADGYEIAVNDQMKEKPAGGRTDGRRGRVLHIYRSMYAFLHSHDTTENGGVFVTNARNLVSVAPKGIKKDIGSLDLTKMNPEVAQRPPIGGPQVAAGVGQRFKRDEDIGKLCYIIKGPHKGLQGIIKDINGLLARVELHTNSKTLTVEKTKLGAKGRDGKVRPLAELARDNLGSGGRPGGGFGSDSRSSFTPSGSNSIRQGGGQSVHGSFGGATPAWGSGNRTSNPYADGSRTSNPYQDGSRTSNPYAASGGQTPAWNNSGSWDPGSRTALASGYGGNNAWDSETSHGPAPTPGQGIEAATPLDPWGARTPAQAPTPRADNLSRAHAVAATDSRRGDRSERREDGSMSSWANGTGSTPFVAAPTPTAYGGRVTGSAPTPSAPTPGGLTPYVGGAPTPAPYATAPTPVGYGTVSTPAVYGAPTPAAYASAPTPYGSNQHYIAPSPAGPYTHGTTAATPYTAATPGAGLLNAHGSGLSSASHIALPENWPVPGIEVVIVHPRDKPAFNGSQNDNQHAIVVGIAGTKSRNLIYTINPIDTSRAIPPVPVEYLEPVPPRAPGEQVVILQGIYRTKQATTISRDASEWMVQLETEEQTIVDIAHLAIYKPM